MSNHDDLFESGLSSILTDPETRIEALEAEVLRRGQLLREQEDELDRLEEELDNAREEADTIRRHCRKGIRWTAGVVGASLVIGLREWLCDWGWALFRAVTDTLRIPRDVGVGAMVSALALWLLWKAGRWTFLATLEELDDEYEEEMTI